MKRFVEITDETGSYRLIGVATITSVRPLGRGKMQFKTEIRTADQDRHLVTLSYEEVLDLIDDDEPEVAPQQEPARSAPVEAPKAAVPAETKKRPAKK